MNSTFQGGAALSADDRAELRALCERATPGEWHATDRGTGWEIHRNDPELVQMLRDDGYDGACWCERPGCAGALPSGMRTDLEEDDARFIAAARTALPRLLDALERKDAALLRYGDALERLANPVDGVDTTRSMADEARHALNPAWPRKGVTNGVTVAEFMRKLREKYGIPTAHPEQGRPSGEAAK